MTADSSDLVIAKRLLDLARRKGFSFRKSGPGQDDPLIGTRSTGGYEDVIVIGGFSRDCAAVRRRRTRLIVPGDGMVERRVSGGALRVLDTVVSHWPT